MANASITPERVEPCFDILMKTSPSPSSGYDPAVRYPSAPPTVKETVCDWRIFGSRRRTGRCSPDGAVAGCAAVCSPAPPLADRFAPRRSDSGWPTLQLSR